MQGPSVLSGIALIRDWEISNDGNNGHAGILQTCLGPMSKRFCVCVCVMQMSPPPELHPQPQTLLMYLITGVQSFTWSAG